MISRIVLSLKKAASGMVRYRDWTVKNLTAVETDEALLSHHELQFRRRATFASYNDE